MSGGTEAVMARCRTTLRAGLLVLLAATLFLILGGGDTSGRIDEVFFRSKGGVTYRNPPATLLNLEPYTAFGAHLILWEAQRPTSTVVSTLGAFAF